MSSSLGKLVRIDDVRSHWPDEARDFTPWLAQAENLQILSETIELELEHYKTEDRIGPFRADIVARNGDGLVIIENQLSPTDHKHLGQIMVYATNREARGVVWIATQFTDEYRKVLDWLNANTPEEVSFFGLEIELWQIGDSAPAPKFNVVCKPNELTKIETTVGEASETKLMQLDFWKAVKEAAEAKSSPISWRKPRPRHWYSIAAGRSGFQISLTAKTTDSTAGCELYITGRDFDANHALELLMEDRDEIEDALGGLEWQPLPTRRACRIAQRRDTNFNDRDAWPDAVDWCIDRAEKFYQAFSGRVQALDLEALSDEPLGEDD
jgi:hypothetical protein